MPQTLRKFAPPQPEGVRLHLGCGRNIMPGRVNIDCVPLPGVDVTFDLESCRTHALPFQDDSVDHILMSHVIEHIRDTYGLMQELYRIAKPGALFVARTPYGSSDDSWEDPTHVRPYFFLSWSYFSQPYHWRSESGYRADWKPETVELLVAKKENEGLTASQILDKVLYQRNSVLEMVATLSCVKPAREAKKALQVLPRVTFIPTEPGGMDA